MFAFLKRLLGLEADEQLKEVLANGAFLVDVRTPAEFAAMSIDGAVNIPLSEVSAEINQFKDKSNIVLFCRSGARANQALKILQQNGIQNVINGKTWQRVAIALKP